MRSCNVLGFAAYLLIQEGKICPKGEYMKPIKKDNEKIEEIKDIEKNGMKELSEAELEGVEGGGTSFEEFAKIRELLPEELEGVDRGGVFTDYFIS